MKIWGTEAAPAGLADILDQRERRAQVQRQLLKQGPCVVSFCMNIPGAYKSFPLASAAFHEGVTEIRQALIDIEILQTEQTDTVAGQEALFLLNSPPEHIKKRMVELEQRHPLGRLWDIDVLDQTGASLSRQMFGYARRTCLICGRDAKICGRSRAHRHEQLFDCITQQMDLYFQKKFAVLVADCIGRGMYHEVSATPKPGLVDRSNNGSHRDMDYPMFLNSITVLTPFFEAFFTAGWQNFDQPQSILFQQLRQIGVQAEQAMFSTTGGVNTHKGMIFSAAILCGALGRLHAGLRVTTLQEVCHVCGQLGNCSLTDFNTGSEITAGMRCYHQNKVSGIRGEAAAGFPSVVDTALPALYRWKHIGAAQNEASLFALMCLIAHVMDTNMIHRGGLSEAMRRQQEAALQLETLTPENITAQLHELDASYIAANLSPGGCADLLSLALAFDFLSQRGLLEPLAPLLSNT